MKTVSLFLIFVALLSGCDLLSPEKGGGPINGPDPVGVAPQITVLDLEHLSNFIWDTRRPVLVRAEINDPDHKGIQDDVKLVSTDGVSESVVARLTLTGDDVYEGSFTPNLGDTRLEIRATSNTGVKAYRKISIRVSDDRRFYATAGNTQYQRTEQGSLTVIKAFDSAIESYEVLDENELWFQVDTQGKLWKVYYDGTQASSVTFDGTKARVYEGNTLVYTKPATNDPHNQIFLGVPGEWEQQLTENACQDIQGEECMFGGTDPIVYRGDIIFRMRNRGLDQFPNGGHPVGKLNPSTGEIDVLFYNPNVGQACSPYSVNNEFGLLGLSCNGGGSGGGYAAIYNLSTGDFVQFPAKTHSPSFLDTPDQVMLVEEGGSWSIWDVTTRAKVKQFPDLGVPLYSPLVGKK